MLVCVSNQPPLRACLRSRLRRRPSHLDTRSVPSRPPRRALSTAEGHVTEPRRTWISGSGSSSSAAPARSAPCCTSSARDAGARAAHEHSTCMHASATFRLPPLFARSSAWERPAVAAVESAGAGAIDVHQAVGGSPTRAPSGAHVAGIFLIAQDSFCTITGDVGAVTPLCGRRGSGLGVTFCK